MLGSSVMSNAMHGMAGKEGSVGSTEERESGTFTEMMKIPINDLHLRKPSETTGGKAGGEKTKPTTGVKDATFKTEAEDILRCKLAATCRLLAKYKFSFGIYNHVSVRSPDNRSFFLINPFGLNYEEVTASSLIKVDSNGNIKEKGSIPFTLNRAGFILHSAIHAARPDINCVLHVHTNAGVAVSALRKGLIPISQEALLPTGVSYHSYEGVLNEDSFRTSITQSLGQKSKVLILHNHGVVSCGTTVEEAWNQLFDVIYACETEWRALAAAGGDEAQLLQPSSSAIQQVKGASTKEQVGLNIGSEIKWNPGEMEFEAEMRLLDYQGLKTGYPYKVKNLFGRMNI